MHIHTNNGNVLFGLGVNLYLPIIKQSSMLDIFGYTHFSQTGC